MLNKNIKFVPILIWILLFELFIGGSGQTFKVFNIPTRQILFVFLLLVFLFELVTKQIKIEPDVSSLIILSLILWVFASAIIGLVNNHNGSIIFKDVTPMLYFFLYFPLKSYFLKYKITHDFILKILLHATILMSIAVIITFILLNTFYGGDVYIFKGIVEQTVGKEVFWFRSEGGFVFYPGLVYSLVAAILLFGKFIKNKKLTLYETLALLLSILALVISMTKGLILSLAIAFLLIIFIKKTSSFVKLSSILLCVLFTVILFSLFDFSRFTDISSDTSTSISTRVKTIEESLIILNDNFLLGNGFGTELPTKKFHQENSFLDIFVEQGFIGVFLYLMLFANIFIRRKYNLDFSIATLAVSLMSLTNPYINNPLGIGLIMITLILVTNNKATRNE
jgi:O-antigen ligase